MSSRSGEQPVDDAGPTKGFRVIVYGGTFISGAVALILQVVWQRYLSLLLGSEARSISLVVAVFLLGLAGGYRFWGNLTHRSWSRSFLLKTLGFIELGIAAYTLVFPQYFGLVSDVAHRSPDGLAVDVVVSAMLLLAPTFLMGASIPVLTAAVPESADEVNSCHARIYGINTLGAFLGALAAGLYLIPAIGLVMTLVIAAAMEAVVGLVFVFNPLRGMARKSQDIPQLPNQFGAGGIYLFVFVIGAVSIGLEVLFARVLSLSMGPATVVFPIVVSVVVLGLAIGSLSLGRVKPSADRVPRDIVKLGIMLAVLYLTVPYWPVWLSHVRVSLSSIPSNFSVYLVAVLLLCSIMLLPLMIPMGRLLPLGYALIDKGRDDYGRMCGRVYFCNTLGTFCGAVGIGYLLCQFFSLPWIFKLNIALLLTLAATLNARSRRRTAAVLCGMAAAAALMLPTWNRITHVLGIYRYATPQEFHFHSPFRMPAVHESFELLSLADDPGATVASYSLADVDPTIAGTPTSMTIAVSGKSDGNTIGDYSNMVLAGLLPYLYAPDRNNLTAAVVGLGTGMTSGALAAAPEVDSVVTLEILPGVIEAMPHFDQANFQLLKNPKSRIVEADAFRFFARTSQRFDIIASEPSNPWVVGVENLFTVEFYQIVNRALAENGVFCQWVQLYSTNDEIFGSICANVLRQFEHVSLVLIGEHDVAIIASNAPLTTEQAARRLLQPAVAAALSPIGIDDPALLTLLELDSTAHVQALARSGRAQPHQVDHPWIGHAAFKASFLHQRASLTNSEIEEFGRHMPSVDRRSTDFGLWMSLHAHALDPWCTARAGRHSTVFVCERLKSLSRDYTLVNSEATAERAGLQLQAYGRLRQQGYIDEDLNLLSRIEEAIAASIQQGRVEETRQSIRALLRQYALDWAWDRFDLARARFTSDDLIRPGESKQIQSQVQEYRQRVANRSSGTDS